MSLSSKPKRVLSENDLREVDRMLLDYLQEGRVTPFYARQRLLSENVGEYSRGYVQQRLKNFEKHGHVQNLGGGLYELLDDPREESDGLST